MSRIENKILKAEQPFNPMCTAAPKDTFIQHVLQRVHGQIEESGDRPWLTDIASLNQPQVKYFSEIPLAAQKAAQAFMALGIKPGDVVQLYWPNSVDYYIPIFGAWLCGAIVSVSDFTLKAESIAHQMMDTKAKVVFCASSNITQVKQGCRAHNILATIVMGHDPSNQSMIGFDEFMQSGKPDAPLPTLNGSVDDCALIFWSSGTTGQPKGIQHSHRNLINLMESVDLPKSTVYTTTMFFHIGGFNIPLSGSIFGNFDIVFHGQNFAVETKHIFEECDKFKPLLMMLGAHHAVHLASAKPDPALDLSSVLAIGPLGSSTHAHLLEDLQANFPNCEMVLNYYGMTEIGSLCNSVSSANLGALLNGREVKIVDPDSLEIKGPHEIGEIWAKTPVTTIGYLNRPELNKDSFADRGFFRTGDLGFYDEDGILYFHDRLKDLIKYKNNHVYPGDIESLIQVHPDVVEVAVYGHPEPTVQELISAVVVTVPGSSLIKKDIQDLVERADVEDYKLIRGPIKFVNALPRNPQGKILRRDLKYC